MQELTKIRLGGQEYPIKLDLNVLEIIQDKFGSINAFQMDILGINVQYGEGGVIERAVNREPSIRAIKEVLPVMINEGLKITADLENREFKQVTAEQIYRECDIHFETLAQIIYNEFKRCFETKKA